MSSLTRRRFLVQSGRVAAAALASGWALRRAGGNPMGRPVGIQLYTVNLTMESDPVGTLKKIRQIGFGEVECAGFGKLSAAEFRRLLDDAGLTCPSAHLTFDIDSLDATFAQAHALGATYATSSSLNSLVAEIAPAATTPRPGMSLEEAKRTAQLANRIGTAARRAGLTYVYHNHASEFADVGDGSVGYDLLLRETDANLVKFEIDCGWMVFAGRNPVDYFNKYPNRFPMIHVKDFLPRQKDVSGTSNTEEMLGAELGRGVVDYEPIFAAAQKAGLQHYFAEQEGPFSRMDQLHAAQVAYDYLHAMV
jgi:sugar phosphate isomerase/epimerase